MKFLKSVGINFWFSAAATLFALLGAILLMVTNGTPGYALGMAGAGIAFAILAVLASAGSAFLSEKFGATHFTTSVAGIAAVVFNVVAISVLILGRANLAASLFTFDAYNNIGWGVVSVSVASMVFFVLSALALMVGAFFGDKKVKSE